MRVHLLVLAITRIYISSSEPTQLLSGEGGETLFSFLTIGDWGGATNVVKVNGAEDEYAVAAALGQVAAAYDSHFLVNVGDNHYYAGVTNTSDPQWVANFEDVFTAPSLSVPWYSILGNHDYGINPEAQVEYRSPNNDRWQMPARYFSKRISIGFNSTGVEQFATFIFLDTNPCIAKYRSDDPSGYQPPPDAAPLFHANIVAEDCGAQLSWLNALLAGLDSEDWVIAAGHHPLEQIDVEDFSSPLMASPMTLYLTGHLHLLRSSLLGADKSEVVSGAGCMVQVQEAAKQRQTALTKEEAAEVAEAKLFDERARQTLGATKVYEETVAGFTAHRFTNDFTILYTEFYDYNLNVKYFVANHKSGQVSEPFCTSSMVGGYCGDDGVNGDSSALYVCTDEVITDVEMCSNGCVTAPQGSSDYCAKRNPREGMR